MTGLSYLGPCTLHLGQSVPSCVSIYLSVGAWVASTSGRENRANVNVALQVSDALFSACLYS